jgi:hypothetical protein
MLFQVGNTLLDLDKYHSNSQHEFVYWDFLIDTYRIINIQMAAKKKQP